MHLNVLLTSMNRLALPTNSITALSAIVLASTKPDILTVAADGAFLITAFCSFSIPSGMFFSDNFIASTTGTSNCDKDGASSTGADRATPFIVVSANFIGSEVLRSAAMRLTVISIEAIKSNSFFIII